MSRIYKYLEHMRRNPNNVRFSALCLICDHYFGRPRQNGTSHRVYEKPWAGDPRISIQNCRGKVKPYQVKQVLDAIEKLGEWKNGNR